MNLTSLILVFCITLGQLIKIPILNLGVTLLDLSLLGFCIFGIYQIKFRLKKPPTWIKAALLFICLSLLSLLLTPLNLDLNQKLASLAYTIRFTEFILFGWLLYSGALPEIRKNITKILTISGVSLATLGLLQLIFLPDLRFLSRDGWDPHYFRVVSTFFDPNFVGAFFVLTLLTLNTLKFPNISIFPHGKWEAIGLVYIALLATFSRGAYLMFFISFLTLALLNKSIRMGVLTLLLSFGLFIGFNIYQAQVAQPRNIDRAQSAEYRLGSWQQGLKLFQDHPILGIGYNSYRYALRQYNLAGEQFLSSRGASSNDSSLLFVAATTGIIGLTGYLFFLGATLWKGLKSKNYILVAGLVGLITQSFFANTLFYPFLLIWTVLITTLNSISEKTK